MSAITPKFASGTRTYVCVGIQLHHTLEVNCAQMCVKNVKFASNTNMGINYTEVTTALRLHDIYRNLAVMASTASFSDITRLIKSLEQVLKEHFTY